MIFNQHIYDSEFANRNSIALNIWKAVNLDHLRTTHRLWFDFRTFCFGISFGPHELISLAALLECRGRHRHCDHCQ